MAGKGAQYVVSVKLTADDAEVRAAIQSLSGQVGDDAEKATKKAVDHVKLYRENFSQMGEALSGFRSQLSLMTGIYRTATAAIGMGITDIVKGSIAINQEFEDLQISLASLLQKMDTSGEFANFNDAMKATRDLIPQMRKEAIETGVSFDSIGESLSRIIPFVQRYGVSLQDAVHLAGSASFWDSFIGRAGNAAQDIRQLLTGQLNPRLIQTAPLARPEVLAAIKKYNQEAMRGGKENLEVRKEELKYITQVMSISDEARQAKAGSFSGMLAGLKTKFQVAFLEGTQPVFDDLKKWLGDVMTWASSPTGAAKIREYARDFADFMRDAATTLFSVFKFFFDNFGIVKTVFIGFMALWAGKNLLSFISAIREFSIIWKSSTFADLLKAIVGWRSSGGAAGVIAEGGTRALRGVDEEGAAFIAASRTSWLTTALRGFFLTGGVIGTVARAIAAVVLTEGEAGRGSSDQGGAEQPKDTLKSLFSELKAGHPFGQGALLSGGGGLAPTAGQAIMVPILEKAIENFKALDQISEKELGALISPYRAMLAEIAKEQLHQFFAPSTVDKAGNTIPGAPRQAVLQGKGSDQKIVLEIIGAETKTVSNNSNVEVRGKTGPKDKDL